MRNTTFISSMVLSVACVSAANADYVLQTFSGSASASAAVSRANTGVDVVDGFSLNYNAIAGGASSMNVAVYNYAYGSTKTTNATNPTTALNAGSYSAGFSTGTGGNTRYFKDYYGGFTGNGTGASPYTANNNYRAWNVNGNVAANVGSSVINFSSTSTVDAGIADWTRIRYTNNSYTTISSANGSVSVNQRSDSADQVGTQGGSSLEYRAVAGRVMDLSSTTGFTGFEIQGSGTGWATQGQVEFYVQDAVGTRSFLVFDVLNGAVMGDYLASVTALQANATSDGLPGTNAGNLDFSKIDYFAITFYDGQNYVSGSGGYNYNGGFSYDASQVNLRGYAPIPAPGALALLGAAGLIGARRRRA
jgi:hypothetical protein